MKNVVWILILAAAGYLAYSVALKPLAGELGEVRSLEKVYNQAVDRYITSMRQAGEPGLIVLADPEFAERKIREARTKADELVKSLREPRAIERAKALRAKIEDFCRTNQID